MFYIIVSGSWGNCIIARDELPTWDLADALTFKTRQEAGDYITTHWKEWADSMDCMRIVEKKMGVDYE